ncbi:MAG TPA: hypothetical protein VKE40_21990 [Gemmataceae bacterium]|nr:hypothetical protein [Gemmataceae bacterium]
MRLRMDGTLRDAAGRLAVAALALLVGLTGCKPAPQVSKYTAPKDPVDTDTVSDAPGEDEPKRRILGAIAPAGNPGENTWYFFKIDSKPKAVERHAAEFDEFIQSLKFPAEGVPNWTLPVGWREVGTQGKERIATFRMKKSETPVELSVTRFGGPLVDNINRWRVDQAGSTPITEAEIETRCRVLTVDGRKVVVVDVSGPGGKGGMPPFAK